MKSRSAYVPSAHSETCRVGYEMPARPPMQGSAFLELALEFGEVVRDLPPRSEPGERGE